MDCIDHTGDRLSARSSGPRLEASEPPLMCNPYPGDKKVKSLKFTGRAAYSKKEAVHEL